MIELNAEVQQKIEVAPGLIILRVSPVGWVLPEFIAGQFTVLALPGSAKRYDFSDIEDPPSPPDKLIKRAYSVASSSKEKQYIEFYIRLVNSGNLTPRLFALNVGDKIWMSPKMTGMFTLNEISRDQNLIFIATGTGLAPYMSMLRSDLVCNEPRKYAVIHGARNSWDLGYRSELLTIERLCHNFTYLNTISEKDNELSSWNGYVGLVEDLWNSEVIQNKWGFKVTKDNTHIFLCGHPEMIKGMIYTLEKADFKEHSKQSPGQIHLEKYW
jgi:ferredoxin--NADP+ reductase